MSTALPKLAQPALRALEGAGVSTLEELAAHPEAEIRKWHGMGPNAMAKLRDAMQANGLTFASENSEEKP